MGDIIESIVSNATEPEWLEMHVLGSIRAWQVMFLALGGVITIIVVLCCCIRFRVPRTKQQIEADYKRRKITNKFRQKLQNIQDAKMDTLSLRDALVLLHAESQLPMEDDKGGDSQRSSILSPQQNLVLLHDESQLPMEDSKGGYSMSSILSPQQNSMEAYAPDGQRPEPQASGTFAKFTSKITTLNKLAQGKSNQPTSPSPSDTTKMDF